MCGDLVARCSSSSFLVAACLLALPAQPLLADPVKPSLTPNPQSPTTHHAPPATHPELTLEQQNKRKERDRYFIEARKLQQQGKPTEAIAAAEKALSLERQVYGHVSRNKLAWVQWLAGMYQQREDFAAARKARQESLDICTRQYGAKDWRVTDARLLLASVDQLAALTPPQRKRLAQAEKAHDEAVALWQQGRSREALELARQAVAIRKEVLGEHSTDYAQAVNNLALVCQSLGEYAQAEERFRLALDIYEQALGQRHPRCALVLNNLAALYCARGNYAQAEPLYGRVVQICKQTAGENSLDHARSLQNLAALYRLTGEYARAEPLLRQVVQIGAQTLGPKQPDYAACLSNLAELYRSMGEYARAEPLYRQALDIRKQVLGEKHLDYATNLDNLAALYKLMGDHVRAESLLRQAQEIFKQAHGEKQPNYAAVLNNLAEVYRYRGDYVRALPLYREAVQIYKETAGIRCPAYATSLNNLGLVYQILGLQAQAEPLLRQSLEIRKQILGEKHPVYAQSLNNLGCLYSSRGDNAQAESLYGQALEIQKQSLGEVHPEYAQTLINLAVVHWSEAARLQVLLPPAVPPCPVAGLCACATYAARTHDELRQALHIARDILERTAAAQSQRQQLDRLAQLRFLLDAYLYLPPQTLQDVIAQYRAVLAWKGAVGGRQRQEHLARKRSDLAEDFAALDRVSTHLATLALAPPDPQHLSDRRREIQKLTDQKERLEARLAGKSAEFRQEQRRQHLEPAQLQAVLPADTVLLDFLEYSQAAPAPWWRGGWHWQRRLAAFVVRRDRLVRVDLGSTQAIKEAVDRWRLALQRRFLTEGDVRLGEQVRRLVWQPLQPYVQGASVVLISPDGPLDRIPFAALPGSRKDRYLLEEVAIAVVPIPPLLPQLLASHKDEPQTEPSLLLVGNVAYDKAAGSAAVADSRPAPRAGALLHWPPLDATLAEVRAIRGCFEDHFPEGHVTTLSSSRATEAAVRQQAPSHRYLHLATHGFFAPQELRSALAALSQGDKQDTGNLFTRRDVAGFHPGLLSGLVLAGANEAPQPGQDDGILTALEVEALDLSGVELAVLSACETGLGEEAGGEGLLGLQRAFQLAGARSVVASLWQVDDKATRELMVRFYEGLWDKKLSKLEALRQAQLWMLREGAGRGMVDVRLPKDRLPIEDGRLAPYYWAAFSLSGDWR